jgi:hypothetical protein
MGRVVARLRQLLMPAKARPPVFSAVLLAAITKRDRGLVLYRHQVDREEYHSHAVPLREVCKMARLEIKMVKVCKDKVVRVMVNMRTESSAKFSSRNEYLSI